MVFASFADDAMSTATGIVLAVFFVVIIIWALHDFVFAMLADIKKSWNKHMSDKK
jgi:hypothetical protein